MPCDPSVLTVAELKEKLKMRKLSTAGSKSELIARLYEADPTGSWVEESETGDDTGEAETDEARGEISQREIELYRREKELAERELDLARREIALLRERLRKDPVDGATEPVTPDDKEILYARPRVSLATVADLLSDFDGISSDFDTWEKQVKFLKATYRLMR